MLLPFPAALGISEAFIVPFLVNVEQDPDVSNFKLHNSVLVLAKDRAATDVAAQPHDLGKDGAVKKHRITAKTTVGGNHNLRPRALMFRNQLVQRFWTNERLVRQNDQCCLHLRINTRQPRLQGGSHALEKIFVEYNLCALELQFSLNHLSGVAKN